jgi:hypothetical protein
MIAYYFPPRACIGSQRPSKLAKYFPDFGWEPIILTAKLPGEPPAGMKVIETACEDILTSTKSLFGLDQHRSVHEQLNFTASENAISMTWKNKVLKLAKEVILFPDNQRGWYKYAIKSAREFLDKEKVDVILSTSSPVTSHVIARELKKEFQIPWVADLRDLWTQNHFYEKHWFIRNFEKRVELKTLALADAIVTVTPQFADKLKILHKNKNISCITNGYDPDDFAEILPKLTNKFTLTYTGTLYDGKRDPSLLFEALSVLIDEKKIDRKLIEIRFFGPREDWFSNAILKYNLNGIVNSYGRVSREEALVKQKESQLLLLLLDINNREKDVYPAKIFEYFGAKRPIIAIGGNGGVVKDLLNATGAGKFAENEKSLKTILYEYYWKYITSGEVTWNGNGIENHAYRRITEIYSDKLSEILKNRICL